MRRNDVPDFIRERFEHEWRQQSVQEGWADFERVVAHYLIFVGENDPRHAFKLALEAALEEARKEREAA